MGEVTPPSDSIEALRDALIEESEKVGAVLSLTPTPFQLEQASNFNTVTVPHAARALADRARKAEREWIAIGEQHDETLRRAYAAEAEAKALREALRNIRDNARSAYGIADQQGAKEMARAALAASESSDALRERDDLNELLDAAIDREKNLEAEAKALREALDWLIAWTSALIDDEWGKQTRPYTGSFEPFEEFLAASESSDG